LTDTDRVEPPTYTVLTESTSIVVIRVTEEFETEERVIPFSRQTVRNESLPEGQQRLIQPGINGVEVLTYRRVLENGIETSRTLFLRETRVEQQPEIIMIGVQAPFSPIPIPGRLAYLSGGNAWIMEGNTGSRRPLVTSTDLDGWIFSLSPDATWLLFTRRASENEPKKINSLWMVNLEEEDAQPVSLGVDNVIHYAGWAPTASQTIYYSTVEPRESAPGWQANNDLWQLEFAPDGLKLSNNILIESNAGGIYGWWGTQFAWSPDGALLAYARPDSAGLVDFESGSYLPLMDILPYQTRGDWAWIPPMTWSPDGQQVYITTHEPVSGLSTPEASPEFNLASLSLTNQQVVPLIQRTGMFAFPQFSPTVINEPERLAYLEAVFPDQSDNSRYRLVLIDRDGSNRVTIFPEEGSTGLEPQPVVWSPSRLESQPRYIAVIYRGNIWLVDPETIEARQVTGDGLVSRIDWR
jgi:hypothetical protein